MQRIVVSYDDRSVRRRIADGDVLLFRSRGLIWKTIAVAGRSEYTHAGMAGWWRNRLMLVEMTSGGGRAQLLSHVADKWPGVVDVYRFNAEHVVAHSHAWEVITTEALSQMIGITGSNYGWWNLLRASFYHLPFLRFMVSPNEQDAENSLWPPFCSQAVASAYRMTGVDLVPNLADRLTEPGDLARSALLQYQFTLE